MFKFSAVSQIWKKYIQKLNDWDLPLKTLFNYQGVNTQQQVKIWKLEDYSLCSITLCIQ